jgi:hypothetical protein
MDISNLEHRFTYHPPTGEQPSTYTEIRLFGYKFALFINALSPDSREKSLAITKIEEAVFWANASIARSDYTEGE